MVKNTLGERIRDRRKAMKLTQSQLATILGYADKTAISKIESGESELNQTKVMRFAEALNTSPSYLMGWVDDPSPKTAPHAKGKMIPTNTSENELQKAYDQADEKTKKAVRVLLGLE